MKKTIIALALAAAALNVAPVSAAQENTDLRFNYTHAATCGIESVSGETGKLIVDGNQKPNPSGSLAVKFVNNTKDSDDTVRVSQKVQIAGAVPANMPPPAFSVYIAEYSDLENSSPVSDNQAASPTPHQIKDDLKWNTQYRAQLKIENWTHQLDKLKGNSVTSAILTVIINC
jgi:hypothetical protein